MHLVDFVHPSAVDVEPPIPSPQFPTLNPKQLTEVAFGRVRLHQVLEPIPSTLNPKQLTEVAFGRVWLHRVLNRRREVWQVNSDRQTLDLRQACSPLL